MPMFPDSGVPAGDAKNSLPDVNTANCAELWYSTSRCQPRFDPAAANAMLAEQMNLIMQGEVQYDCTNLNHIQRAVRYLIQRGLQTGVTLVGGPFDYWGTLDPGITRYNDYMTLIIVPNVSNQAAVRLDFGKGFVPLLRNDYQQLQGKDLRAGIPILISYYGGNWFLVGLASSQVPIVVQGGVDIWIRTDGNDSTGDGSENSAAKAFQTIAGAWRKVGSRFAATPLFTMNLRLGIPGTYAGAILGPFGGGVTLSGAGVGGRADYRIVSIDGGNNIRTCLYFAGMAAVQLFNLTIVSDVAPPFGGQILRAEASGVVLYTVDFDMTIGNSNSCLLLAVSGGTIGTSSEPLNVFGHNLPVGQFIVAELGGIFVGCHSMVGGTYNIHDCHFVDALRATGLGQIGFMFMRSINSTNCTGVQYTSIENSIIRMNGMTPPGNLPGATGSGGQFLP